MTPAVPRDPERYFDSFALSLSMYSAAVYQYTQKLAGEEIGWILKDIHGRDSCNASVTAVLDYQ